MEKITMTATGIIRRIDDLGRIVIPKEIRRKLRVKESDAFEIFIADGDKVIFKKIDNNEDMKES